VEDASTRGKGTVGLAGIAGGSVSPPKLLGSESVVDVVGVALPAESLINQCLDSGHRWRTERGSSAALHDGVVLYGANSAALAHIGHALQVEAAPHAIAGEEREIGLITKSIVGDAGNAELISRLGIAFAGAAHYTRDGRLAREAGAWPAAAAHVNQKILPQGRIAEATGPVGLSEAAVHRIAVNELARAAVIPGNLRNIGKRGSLRLGIVCGAPVIAHGDTADVRIVLSHEIGAAHVDGIGGGGVISAVDAEATLRGLIRFQAAS